MNRDDLHDQLDRHLVAMGNLSLAVIDGCALTPTDARSLSAFAAAARAVAAVLALPEPEGGGQVWTADPRPEVPRLGSEWEQDAEVPR